MFVDTNVLVYAHDASEILRQPAAQAVLATLWRARTETSKPDGGSPVCSSTTLRVYLVIVGPASDTRRTPDSSGTDLAGSMRPASEGQRASDAMTSGAGPATRGRS